MNKDTSIRCVFLFALFGGVGYLCYLDYITEEPPQMSSYQGLALLLVILFFIGNLLLGYSTQQTFQKVEDK